MLIGLSGSIKLKTNKNWSRCTVTYGGRVPSVKPISWGIRQAFGIRAGLSTHRSAAKGELDGETCRKAATRDIKSPVLPKADLSRFFFPEKNTLTPRDLARHDDASPP